MPSSMARRFGTGNAPGRPRHTGQTIEFGFAPNTRAEQPQNIFVSVASSRCVSNPMTSSYGRSVMAFPG